MPSRAAWAAKARHQRWALRRYGALYDEVFVRMIHAIISEERLVAERELLADELGATLSQVAELRAALRAVAETEGES